MAAERQRVHVGVQTHLDLRPALAIEREDVAAMRPARAPEGAVRGEGEVVDADVAEVAEGSRDGVEDLDAVAGGHVQRAVGRMDGERLGDAVAVVRQHRAAARIELQ